MNTEKSTSKIQLEPTDKEKKSIDKTSVDLNSKAKPIDFPKQTGSLPTNKKENAEIELKFSETQLIEKGKSLVKALTEKGDLEDEKKSASKSFQDRIDSKQTIVESLSKEIKDGCETKMVSCEIIRNFDSGKREYMYQGKKVKEEVLRASDHQMEISVTDMKVVKTFDMKLKAGDWVLTKKGTVVEIIAEDIPTLNYDNIDRLATQKEIEYATKNRK